MKSLRSRLLRGGWVVTPEQIIQADVLIQGEWIAAVGPHLDAGQAEVIDAYGLYILPGLIDAHVHLREPGAEHKEDITSGTRAALAGGCTTVLDMPNSPHPTTTLAAFAEKAHLVQRKACCDVGLFFGATPENAKEAAQAHEAVGLKLYMGSSTGQLLVSSLASQFEHFRLFPRERPLAVHAEDEEAVAALSSVGRRPGACAEIAVAKAIALARLTRRHLHICHVSTAVELGAIALARRQGVAVSCEVTPHHLFLTHEAERTLDALAHMNPPLRTPADQEALWQHLDEIDIVASDHAPHTLAEKRAPSPPAGVPGLETTLPLLLNAVTEGRLTLGAVVRLMAERPARLFSLARKGRVAPGFSADLVLVDLNAKATLGQKLYTKCGWTPFAGMTVTGKVQRVLLRGADAVVAGEVLAEPGWGRLVEPS